MKKMLLIVLVSMASIKAVKVTVIDTDGHLHHNITIPKNSNKLKHNLEQAGFNLDGVENIMVGFNSYDLDVSTNTIFDLQDGILIVLQYQEFLNILNGDVMNAFNQLLQEDIRDNQNEIPEFELDLEEPVDFDNVEFVRPIS